MKIVLFQAGRPGREYIMPGDKPEADLADMLGGAVELTTLNKRLEVITRVDGEKLRLPIHYAMHRIGRAVEPLAGDCAVVARTAAGQLTDIGMDDVAAAVTYIRTLEGRV